jgi:hypothetical protein
MTAMRAKCDSIIGKLKTNTIPLDETINNVINLSKQDYNEEGIA